MTAFPSCTISKCDDMQGLLLIISSCLQVPIAGCYRLIDIPMSNCINSGIRKVYVLTQFNSFSLNGHLSRTYNFGNGVNFGGGVN